jgi:hypothetical protein
MRNIVIILFSFVCGLTFAQTNIYFKSGSYNIDSEGKETLRKLAENSSGKNVAVFVQGYADTTGTIEGNRSLARNREKAVISFLSKNGIRAEEIETPCVQKTLSLNDLSNAKNRRVCVTVDELVAYSAKDGSVVLAPKSIKLQLEEQYYQPHYCVNKYRNIKCQIPPAQGRWYTDVILAETPVDTCNFIIVKRPIGKKHLPIIFLGDNKYDNFKVFQSYTTDLEFEFFRIPIYKQQILLDRFFGCGYKETTYLKIILPKEIKPIKASLFNECISLYATYKKDTLRVEYDTDASIAWEQLNLSIKTRDTVYSFPMSDFDEILKEEYSGGIYTLAIGEQQNNLNEIPETVKEPAKIRRTFWQRIGDLFR